MTNEDRAMKPPTIVVVDDEENQRTQLASELANEGYRCVSIETKSMAYYWIVEHQPALIISDIKSPNLDGFEFLKMLKENPETQHIPFIFVTGHADIESAIRANKMGAADFVAKPLHLPDLLEAIQRVLPEHPAGRGTQQVEREKPLVTLLDDDDTALEVLGSALQEEGYNVMTFQYKDEFLSHIKRNPHDIPDVVVTDIKGPRMDGLQFLREFRADARHTQTPVIVFSGHIPAYTREAMRLGAYACISKLAGIPDILQSVQHAVQSSRERREGIS